MATHKDLDVWKKSIELVREIYKTVSLFPKEEMYSLTAQVKRAAISVPANISEGSARNSPKEFVQFLYISLGSLSELETLLIIAKQLKFIKKAECLSRVEEIKKMLISLIRYHKELIKRGSKSD